MKSMNKIVNKGDRSLIILCLGIAAIFVLMSYASAKSYSDCNIYGMCKSVITKTTTTTSGLLPLYSVAPTCNLAARGQTIILTGAGGVADIEQVCVKTILDTYVWKVVGLT